MEILGLDEADFNELLAEMYWEDVARQEHERLDEIARSIFELVMIDPLYRRGR